MLSKSRVAFFMFETRVSLRRNEEERKKRTALDFFSHYFMACREFVCRDITFQPGSTNFFLSPLVTDDWKNLGGDESASLRIHRRRKLAFFFLAASVAFRHVATLNYGNARQKKDR